MTSQESATGRIIIIEIKVYIIYIIRLYISNKEVAKGVREIMDLLLPPSEAGKKGVGHAVRPPSKHYSSRGKEELSPFLSLSMKGSFQKEY
jgi:hypothetical protein